MRIFLLLIISFLIAAAEDSVLLTTHIRMIPKIMALEIQPSSNNTPSLLGVIYDGERKSQAQAVADEINHYHNGKVANLTFIALAVSVNELSKRNDISFAYLIQMSASSVAQAATWGLLNSTPTFSYDLSDLEYGVLGSIAIERTTVIYINKTILKKGKFHFNDALFQIARLIE